MATLTAEKGPAGKPNGCWRILFFDRSGKRRTIRPGCLAKKTARDVCNHITELEKAARFGVTANAATLTWAKGIENDLHGKLAKHGLCEPRLVVETVAAVPTVRQFVDEYIASRVWNDCFTI